MKPIIPFDVPQERHELYCENYCAITRKTNNLFLLTYDHKIEHLNYDFAGNSYEEIATVEHAFRIAAQGTIGAMAAPYGLITRHARDYPSVNYIVKLNGKTPLLPADRYEPYSIPFWSVKDACMLREQEVSIRGIGLTIYFGSEHEAAMLEYAAHAIVDAHHHGFVAIVWAYPRGKNIKDPYDETLLAGVAGAAHALGADFVKIQRSPKFSPLSSIAHAADNSGIIYSGGQRIEPSSLLNHIAHQQKEGGRGCAIGRNIFQRRLPEAISLTKAIAAMVYENTSAQDALALYNSLLRFLC